MEQDSEASMAVEAPGMEQQEELQQHAEQGTSTGDTEQGTGTGDPGGAAAAEAPKATMMSAVGPNFVIPKNKALVPVTRTTKWEPLDPKKEIREELRRRKTRWCPDLADDPVVKRGRALAYQTRAEQLAAQLEANNLEIDNNEATRSPSPPPIYDAMGHRMNTREGRKRDRLDMERREALGECMNLNPFFKVPAGYRPVLKEDKCFIPAKENPGYNFIGLILGPRGNTQKRLENETGCKITIRGKGSIKDGKSVPYRFGKDNDGISEDLHVHIAAETWEKVDAAVAIIEPLLIPVDEDRNIYKMKQLRELAEMNGTVREFFRICTLCGEEGHKEWQCPKDKLQLFQAKVICRFCGDASHPTMDCPLKLSGQGKAIDKEYLSFLEELGVGLGGIDAQTKADLESGTTGPASESLQSITASAAQPMFGKWMEGFNEFNRRMAAGGSENGGFPRFPFPFPFPPAGPHAMRFLAPFLNPAFMEAFKGRPVPPPMQMMAFMFSAFRGRFPFPPFGGFRPDMMRQPMPPSSVPEDPPPIPPSLSPTGLPSMSMDISSLGKGQPADLVAEGLEQNNYTFLPSSGTESENEQQHTEGVPSVISSADALTFSSPVSNRTHSLEPMPRSSQVPAFSSMIPSGAEPPVLPIPPVAAPSMLPSVTSSQVPAFSSMIPTTAEPPSVFPIPPVAPPPILPSVRPFPSVRPVIQPPGQVSSFTPMGYPGFSHTVASPLGVGTSNVAALEAKSMPTWNQSHSSLASDPEKSVPEADFSIFATPGPVDLARQSRADSYHSFSSGENRSHPSGLDNSPFVSRHPSSLPTHLGSYPQRSVPFGAPTLQPSFISSSSPSFPTQYGMAGDSQLKNPFSRPESLYGSHFGSVGASNAASPVEDYRFFSSSSRRANSGLSAPSASMSHSANAYQHYSTFTPSEVPYARSHDHLLGASADVGMHVKYGSNDANLAGARGSTASYDRELKGSSSKTFERNYNYEPSIAPHILQQNSKSPWTSDFIEPGLHYSSHGDNKRWV